MLKRDSRILKIGEQTFMINDYLHVENIKFNYSNLYVVTMDNTPLLFITPYFLSVLLSKEIVVCDGFIKEYPFIKFLEERKKRV